jgi:hypothetical protein
VAVLGPHTAGNLLELIVLISREGDEIIIHAMPMQPSGGVPRLV